MPIKTIPYPLSNNDIGSWCGIFCVAIFRLAGLKVQDWQVSKKGGLKIDGLLNGTGATVADFRTLRSNEIPQPGDIGIEDGTGLNHHFIIVEVNGDSCVSVEGNAGHNPNCNYSEIIRRGPGGVRGARSVSAFRRGSGNFFLTPNWGQLGVK